MQTNTWWDAVCGTDEPAFFCDLCNDEISEEQSRYNLCATCEADALKRFKESLMKFTANELNFLDDCIEGNTLTEPDKIPNVTAYRLM